MNDSVSRIKQLLIDKAPDIDWVVESLNDNSIAIRANKAYMNVCYSITLSELGARLDETVKQLVWLMKSVTPINERG